jgi:hypothetical protein
MECVAVIAGSAMLIFAKLAQIQDLNPFLWGFLAFVVYAGAPAYLVFVRKAGLMDAPIVWISSFGGLFGLFIVQSIVAEWKKRRSRGH